jgi:hypothetical protein
MQLRPTGLVAIIQLGGHVPSRATLAHKQIRLVTLEHRVDLGPLVAETNNKPGRVGAHVLILGKRELDPRRAVNIRALTQKRHARVRTIVDSSYAVFDALVRSPKPSLVLRITISPIVYPATPAAASCAS